MTKGNGLSTPIPPVQPYTPPPFQPARQHISPFGFGGQSGFQPPQYSPLQQMQSRYYGNPYRFGSK